MLFALAEHQKATPFLGRLRCPTPKGILSYSTSAASYSSFGAQQTLSRRRFLLSCCQTWHVVFLGRAVASYQRSTSSFDSSRARKFEYLPSRDLFSSNGPVFQACLFPNASSARLGQHTAASTLPHSAAGVAALWSSYLVFGQT